MFTLSSHLNDGARSSGEIRRAAGVSRDTIARAYSRERASIIRLGHARATRYAVRKTHPGLNTDTFPVFRVDERGALHADGQLITLAADQSALIPADILLDGLPPEIADAAPSGFLGRSYAMRHGDLGLPKNPSDWSDHHILLAISRRGEDLPGHLIVGAKSFDRYQALKHQSVSTRDFAVLAEKALAGEHAGSSAGGEQPKFTAFVDGVHRIVKFATDATDNGRRWQDLLLLEHLALETLRGAGIAAAATAIVDLPGLRCLVVDRFDRIGEHGRRGVMSLAAAGAEINRSWSDSAVALYEKGRIDQNSARQIAFLDAYGALIANTDRHPYNVLLTNDNQQTDLAPAFDQLPMAYAPPASGNIRNMAINRPRPSISTLPVWEKATALALSFWRQAGDLTLSAPMSAIAREHVRQLRV
ncbi:MAG: HipA domain-containing protein [Pseudomonadota bacterium]